LCLIQRQNNDPRVLCSCSFRTWFIWTILELLEFDLSKASHGLYCEEVSNIDGSITLRENRLGGCDQVNKTDYSNYEQYGFTKYGDSTSAYLRPK
jgi:hypothetical protein